MSDENRAGFESARRARRAGSRFRNRRTPPAGLCYRVVPTPAAGYPAVSHLIPSSSCLDPTVPSRFPSQRFTFREFSPCRTSAQFGGSLWSGSVLGRMVLGGLGSKGGED